ncbi:hypothetical protein [Streptomyces sp. NRRL S-337]|uniref:hypothetical protein n=1 Tax=Streptomyces sp. NRRL S-337 TaxID=1463900 RepID=UPI0004C5054B|nr:hypothetical protein [Streptomyces sp. NRRL S-337]
MSDADDVDHWVGAGGAGGARCIPGGRRRGGRPSGSGGPLGLGRPVDPAVGIPGRFDRGPSHRFRRAGLRLEAALPVARRIVRINA